MKKSIAFISLLTILCLLIIPFGTVFADQACHTERMPLYITPAGETAGYTLRNGHVINIHPHSENNLIILDFMLNGAKPNTTFALCRLIADSITVYIGGRYYVLPPGFVADSGYRIDTDKNGNGNFSVHISVEDNAFVITRTFTLKFIVKEVGTNIIAYETDFRLVNLD